jgi:hypothetical protein
LQAKEIDDAQWAGGRSPHIFSVAKRAVSVPDFKSQNSSGTTGEVRAPHSAKADLAISIWLGQFEEELIRNGVAFPGEDGVFPLNVSNLVSPEITAEAPHKGHGRSILKSFW